METEAAYLAPQTPVLCPRLEAPVETVDIHEESAWLQGSAEIVHFVVGDFIPECVARVPVSLWGRGG